MKLALFALTLVMGCTPTRIHRISAGRLPHSAPASPSIVYVLAFDEEETVVRFGPRSR